MIISHKHKFIFFKTRKTAGTSLEIALSKICGPDDIITPISEKDELKRKEYANISAQNYQVPLKFLSKSELALSILRGRRTCFYNHATAKEIKGWISNDIWESYFKFSIDRNPFDKIVSLYYWRDGHNRFGKIYDFIKKGGLSNFTSYDIYSVDGVVAADEVYKYEDLDTACKDLTSKLNLDDPIEMPKYRAKSASRETKNYKEILDERSVKLIETIFAREIKLLGYTY